MLYMIFGLASMVLIPAFSTLLFILGFGWVVHWISEWEVDDDDS